MSECRGERVSLVQPPEQPPSLISASRETPYTFTLFFTASSSGILSRILRSSGSGYRSLYLQHHHSTAFCSSDQTRRPVSVVTAVNFRRLHYCLVTTFTDHRRQFAIVTTLLPLVLFSCHFTPQKTCHTVSLPPESS